MSIANFSFKNEHNYEKRIAESGRILNKFPERVPIIVEKNPADKTISNIDKSKYLVPADLTVGQFVYIIRKRIKLEPEKALFLFINNFLPPTSALISEIYEKHKDMDNFLYVNYTGENTFGRF